MIRPLRSIVVAFPFLCLGLAAIAQTTQIQGQISDSSGAVIPKAVIRVVDQKTGIERRTETNDSGIYVVPALNTSLYKVFVQATGFSTAVSTPIALTVGQNAILDFKMQVGQASQTVTVNAGNLQINTTDGSVSTVVDRNFVENIPLNGRSFQSLITLTPGIVLTPSSTGTNYDGQFSVNGQRATGNAFSVDGVSANFGTAPNMGPGPQTSGNNPGLTTLGTTQSLVSVDDLQEFQIQTSSYAAEYGRQPGAQISLVTRSGTNNFHGSLFEYLRNNVFDANDWFADNAGQPKAPERQNDFGGTLGGPILLPKLYNGHDRTFFFLSYEGLRLALPQFLVTNVPTMALRQQSPPGVQPLLNAFPEPNGVDLGNGFADFSAPYSNPSSLDATSIRIDHAVNSKLTIFGRYNHAPSQSVSRSPSNLSETTPSYIRTDTLTLGLTASASSRFTNEFRANYSNNAAWSGVDQTTFGGAIPVARDILVPSQYDSTSAQGTAAFFFNGLTATSTPFVDFVNRNISSQRQYNIVDNVSYGVRTHQFKFGIDWRRLTPVYNVNSYATEVDFYTDEDVLDSAPGDVYVESGLPVRPLYMNLSLFGQDTWKISSRVTLDLGLRWEMNPPPAEASGNLPLAVTEIGNLATMQLAPRGNKLWETTLNNFAPRLGVAYRLGGDSGSETVIRSGFGVFYDTGNDLSAFQFAGYPFGQVSYLTEVAFPLIPSQVAPPSIPSSGSTLAPPYGFLGIDDPHLKLPYTLQWNMAIERSLGSQQALTITYVGAAGRNLLQSTQYDLSSINPDFTTVQLTTNIAKSNYDALQLQFQRRLSRGLQALASYTWAHALDDDSTSYTNLLERYGNAEFDVRHIFAGAATYDLPKYRGGRLSKAVANGWLVDIRAQAQSAMPVDLVAEEVTDPANGSLVDVRPNVIAGVPFYIYESAFPGGRSINPAAFSAPPSGLSGDLGRNQVRGLDAWQIDSALHREFSLREQAKLQFRAEAFNVLNHPNFGGIQTLLTTSNFGQATQMLNRYLGGLSQLYQIGGPRSLQFALRLQF